MFRGNHKGTAMLQTRMSTKESETLGLLLKMTCKQCAQSAEGLQLRKR
jgi:hypothetical protein